MEACCQHAALSAWAFTAAAESVGCPRCARTPGAACAEPSGRKAKRTHSERVDALVAAFPCYFEAHNGPRNQWKGAAR